MNLESLKIGGSWWSTAGVATLVVVGVAVVVTQGAKIRAFCGEVGVELKKCSWPWNPEKPGLSKYKELMDSTFVVIVSTILLAAFVTFSDFILLKVVGFLTRLH